MRPNWHLTWIGNVSSNDQDGVTHRFRLRIGDRTSEHEVGCGRSTIATFLNQTFERGWTEELAGIALCATKIKDERNTLGPPAERLNVWNASSKIMLVEVEKLRSGEEINLD